MVHVQKITGPVQKNGKERKNVAFFKKEQMPNPAEKYPRDNPSTFIGRNYKTNAKGSPTVLCVN